MSKILPYIEKKIILKGNMSRINANEGDLIKKYIKMGDQPYWNNFRGCMNGPNNGIESGSSISITADGKLMIVGSLYSAVLYDYDRETGWNLVKDFFRSH